MTMPHTAAKPNPDDLDALVWRVPEVARLLSISTRSVYVLIERGELATVRCGRAVRIPKPALTRFLQQDQPDRAVS